MRIVFFNVLLIPLFFYSSSYYLLVQKEPEPLAPLHHNVDTYRFGGVFSKFFFLPIHCLDRRIRPNYWKPRFPDLPSLADEYVRLSGTDAVVLYISDLKQSFVEEFFRGKQTFE